MSVETIVLHNDLKELERLGSFLRSLSEAMSMDDQTLYQVNLVCDELVTNIILYGYPPEEACKHTIRLELGMIPGGWGLQISDRGVAFNPLSKSGPRIDLSLEERHIGGLGIHFVKQVMDEITYERVADENVLTLKKWRM